VNPIQVKLSLSRLGGLPQKIEVIVYRLVQECFNNIGKHSQATTVNVSVTTADGVLRLDVEDNGVGFVVEEALARRDSFGLSGMRERVALLGGSFRLWSFPRSLEKNTPSAKAATQRQSAKREKGTKISIELPMTSQGSVSSGSNAAGAIRAGARSSTAEWAAARRKLGTRSLGSGSIRPEVAGTRI
jgi:glucose-6-phosphate-specific signal transduction histidine kinase